MNQILYTGGKKGNSGTGNTKTTVIVFIIFIIIFAICLIAIGYNLFSNVKSEHKEEPNGITENPGNSNITNTTIEKPEETEKTNPIIQSKITIKFDSQLGGVKAKITSKQKLKEISYWWDEEEQTIIETEENEYEILIPSRQGAHTLNVKAIDQNGTVESSEQLVIGDAEPELIITTDGVSNYVIKAKDDEKIKKIVIVLNEEIKEVEVNEKEIEYKVPIPQGYSLIDVTVYNINDISVNKKAKITNFGG